MPKTVSEHTLRLIPDYTLGLLPAEDRRLVEQHTRSCDECLAALRRERQLIALVRSTITAAAPGPGRLEALRPAFVPRPAPRTLFLSLAPATLAAFVLCVGLLLVSTRSPLGQVLFGSDGTPVLTSSPTSTSTRTPTATLAATGEEPDEQPIRQSTMPPGPALALPVDEPPVATTPVARAAP
jgi:hypothetical protein